MSINILRYSQTFSELDGRIVEKMIAFGLGKSGKSREILKVRSCDNPVVAFYISVNLGFTFEFLLVNSLCFAELSLSQTDVKMCAAYFLTA